jgi:hypothetical protein
MSVMVQQQKDDIESAIFNKGPYELAKPFRIFYVSETEWFKKHTYPILRYATNGKNVLTTGKYEYRFVTCSAKRNMISLLGYSPTVCRGDRIQDMTS